MPHKSGSSALARERQEITLAECLSRCVLQKKVEGHSPRTGQWYQESVGAFVKWLEGAGGSSRLADTSLESVNGYIAHLQSRTTRYPSHAIHGVDERALSTPYINKIARALRAFFRWVHAAGYTKRSIVQGFVVPKVKQQRIEIVTPEDISRLLSGVNGATLSGARTRATVLLLYDTGIRAGEYCGLTLDDLHFDDGYIKVLGKGNKERLVPIGGNAQAAMLRYVQTFRPEPAMLGDRHVFLSMDGYPMRVGTLEQMFSRLARRAGLDLHPHKMRHSFAVAYLLNGGDIATLKSILGHTDISVTQVYLRMAESLSAMKLQHRRASPADKLDLRSTVRGRPAAKSPAP